MARQIAIPCADCRQKFGGDETYRRHRRLAGDSYRCVSTIAMLASDWHQDRDGVWHRPVGSTARLSVHVRPTESDAGGQLVLSGVANTPARRIARIGDPDTSHAAAKSISYRTGTAKARLLEVYRSEPDGLTDEEAATRCGMSLYEATKRCSDLRNDGWITPTGVRKGSSGLDRRVCRVAEQVSA